MKGEGPENESYRHYGSSPRRLYLHVVILRATTNLAEQSGAWIGRDPSTPPRCALDDTMRNRASEGLSNIAGLEL